MIYVSLKSPIKQSLAYRQQAAHPCKIEASTFQRELSVMKNTTTRNKEGFSTPIKYLLSGIALIAAMLNLAACSEKPQPPKLLQQERDALSKARGVEQTEAKGAEDLRMEVEKQAQ